MDNKKINYGKLIYKLIIISGLWWFGVMYSVEKAILLTLIIIYINTDR